MATWVLTQGSSTITFNSDPFWLMEATGVGSAPVRRLNQRGPLQDGVSDLGYRLEPRTINLTIMIVGASKSATDGHRDTLAALLKPSSTPVVLKYTRDDAAVRQIDCYVVNQVDMPAQRGERIGFWQRVVVQLVAPNPLWYDPTAASAVTTSSAVGWQLASGQISSGVVAETVATPTQGQNITAVDRGTGDWTIALRTAPAAAGTEYLMYVRDDSSGGRFDGVVIGRVYLELFYGNVIGSNKLALWSGTGTQNIIISKALSGSSYIYKVWRDGTLIHNTTLGGVTWSGVDGEKWRSDYAGANTWTAALTRAAIYTSALSDTQVAALNSTLTSGDTTSYAVAISYSGSADDYPIMALAGPITSPIISNGLTGTTLDFTGHTVADGTTLYIDLRYGYKTVVDSAGTNRIDKLTSDSDLSTWRLAPGTNNIGLAGSSTGTNTELRITYTNRYWSQ